MQHPTREHEGIETFSKTLNKALNKNKTKYRIIMKDFKSRNTSSK